jgi:excisionase family DNA binding protein
MDELPELRVPEVATLTQHSPSWVRWAAQNGLIPSYKIGGRLFFRRREIEAYVERSRRPAKEPVAS